MLLPMELFDNERCLMGGGEVMTTQYRLMKQ